MATISIQTAERQQSAASRVRQTCPHCGSRNIHRSHSKGIIERHVMRVFRYYPHRCEVCGVRFYARLAALRKPVAEAGSCSREQAAAAPTPTRR